MRLGTCLDAGSPKRGSHVRYRREQWSDFSRDVEKGGWFAALRREPATYI